MPTRHEPDTLPTDSPEVRAYLKHLSVAILLGILLMGTTAVWAWNKWGGKLSEAPPLPSGVPPTSSVPATTR